MSATETRNYFNGCDTPAEPVATPRPVSQPARHAPTAVDLLLKVLGDAHARIRSPKWSAERLAEIDLQINTLMCEREAIRRLTQ